MTDTEAKPENLRKMPGGGNLPIVIHAQYIKDMSFENPNTPASLRGNGKAPEMDVNIGMDARKLDDKEMPFLYEVALNVRAEAKNEGNVVFIAELQYGITVSLNDVPEDQHHPLLLIEIPRMAFPYARQILSDLTVQGGYPPLLLNPVDFQALYMDRFKDEIAAAQKAMAEKDSETVN
ncbi:MAG: protein-export chaperone SecB [Alphaproteobacteria bacterium]